MQTETIAINGTKQAVREFQGRRVVTLRDVDRVHNRPEGTARNAFRRNNKRFVKGTDYFVRDMYEARQEFGISAPNGLTLLTESGYLMIAKVFNDNIAWAIQRELVNCYFKMKAQPEASPLAISQPRVPLAPP
ncbi:MAG: ORF6N domain-containing protein, partial [Oscillospiraceae bacterium]